MSLEQWPWVAFFVPQTQGTKCEPGFPTVTPALLQWRCQVRPPTPTPSLWQIPAVTHPPSPSRRSPVFTSGNIGWDGL